MIVYELLRILYYFFSEIKSVYNDIDFENDFDHLILVKIIKLIKHDVTKVYIIIIDCCMGAKINLFDWYSSN